MGMGMGMGGGGGDLLNNLMSVFDTPTAFAPVNQGSGGNFLEDIFGGGSASVQ